VVTLGAGGDAFGSLLGGALATDAGGALLIGTSCAWKSVLFVMGAGSNWNGS
jgi:hypothetical protein